MKQLLLFASLFVINTDLSAQHQYPQDVHSAAAMNVKGPVKKITEKTIEIDKNGSQVEAKYGDNKTVYMFDKNRNIIKREVFEIDEESEFLEETNTYEFTGGRLTKETIKTDEGGTYIKLFSYSGNTITVKDGEVQNIRQLQITSNNRVTSIEYYNSGSTSSYDMKEVFEYNKAGLITKKTTEIDEEKYEKYTYNSLGDIVRTEYYEKDKLVGVATMVYTYDNYNNWTKCISSWSRNQKTREQITRTYEMDPTQAKPIVTPDNSNISIQPSSSKQELIQQLNSELKKTEGHKIWNRMTKQPMVIAKANASVTDTHLEINYTGVKTGDTTYKVVMKINLKKIKSFKADPESPVGTTKITLYGIDTYDAYEYISASVRGSGITTTYTPSNLYIGFPASMSEENVKKLFKDLAAAW